MAGYKRIEKYVYQYWNKYKIIQGQNTWVTSTLEEALQLKQELIKQGKIVPRLRGPHPRDYEDRYINETKSGTYQIRKMVDGEPSHFGTFKTMEDAREERDYLESIGWDYDNME